jgi:hypothetical protein
MPLHLWTYLGISWFLAASVAYAETDKELDPLFQSTDIIEARITAPFHTILTERSDQEDVDGKFSYMNGAELMEMDIGIRARGISRRDKETCLFPPLRLDFKKSQVKKSLFHKQDKLKLVTHCQDQSERYEQTVLREYLAYRILNELTDVSFRVRLMRITYIDTGVQAKDRTYYGFVIEHKDRLAKRLGIDPLELDRTTVRELRPDYTNLISMFHYMVGNTDFSPIAGAEASCCHNHVLLGQQGDLLYSVPYDFDQAGLVDAPHGAPNPRFRLRNAKQRLYRGRCVNNDHLDTTLALYADKRAAIFELVEEQQGLSERTREDMKRFLARFYDTIGNAKQVRRKIIKKCI